MHRPFGPLAVVAALLLVSACTPSTPTSPIAVSSSSTPTPSATSLDPATQDLRGAEQAIVALVAKADALAQDPTTDAGDIAMVARDEAFNSELSVLIHNHKNGYVQVGFSKVLDPHAVLAGTATWSVTACIDVSGTDVVDKSGKSVVSPSRAPRYGYTYSVIKDGIKFYVTKEQVTGTC